MVGRPRKTGVARDAATGRSRGDFGIHPETLAIRDRELKAAGVPLTFIKRERTAQGWADVEKPTARNDLAGFTLGILRLRPSADPGSISERQYQAGNSFCEIVHEHAAIMGYKITIASPGFMGSGGKSLWEPSPARIAKARDNFRKCFDSLMEGTRLHGKRVWQVTYGVCVENWHHGHLTPADYGHLRTGLNCLWKAL